MLCEYEAPMTAEFLLSDLKKRPFLLAPMAGISDSAFRLSMRELGSGPVISELVSANGLKYANEKTEKLMRFDLREKPVGIQIFGEDGGALAMAAKRVQELGADFVDLNLGCPVKKIVKKGAGSALLKEPLVLKKILLQIKAAIDIPLTIKIRTGWDGQNRNASEVVQVAADSGVTWVAIHGRTRSQAYNGVADWDFIGDVKAKSSLPIIGNGDVKTPEGAVRRLQTYGVDGVMIGRGCLKNPNLFLESHTLWKEGKLPTPSFNYNEFFKVLFERTSVLYDEKFVMIQMRKFSTWASAGFPGAAQFRRDMFTTRSLAHAMELIFQFYSRVTNESLEISMDEKFLMGGHG